MIAALFVQTGGGYFGLPGVDAWDEPRDARKYEGPWPVVAHPPCTRWCQMAAVVQARYGYRIGDDDGCFESALHSVRTWGGVLEHPAFTKAWPAFGLQRPMRGRWLRGSDHPFSWVCQVSQGAYGHRARKLTWLYYVGPQPPELDWAVPRPTATISFMVNHGGGTLPRLSKREASATPPAFRDALLALARGSR